MRRLQILLGATILEYPSVAFRFNVSVTLQRKSRLKAHQRVVALRPLHECNDICLKPLAKKSYRGHACQPDSGTCILFHFSLTSYVADVPESKNLLEIKRRGQTKYPCHKRMVMKQKLP